MITNNLFQILSLFFAINIILCSFLVILSKNPIYSIFFLILVFLNTTAFLILIGAEFIALLLLIVYVGAIAVLFLFVVMMLNVKLLEINEPYWKYSFISFLIIVIFFLQIFKILMGYFNFPDYSALVFHVNNHYFYTKNFKDWSVLNFSANNVNTLGNALFVHFCYSFVLISVLLLLAMISAIILTLNYTLKSKKQLIFRQVMRSLNDSVTRYYPIK